MTVLIDLCTADEPFELGDQNAARVRRLLFEGLTSLEVFAAASGRSRRTAFTWIGQGLPIVYFGRTPMVKVDAAREWLLSRRGSQQKMQRRPRPMADEAASLAPTAA